MKASDFGVHRSSVRLALAASALAQAAAVARKAAAPKATAMAKDEATATSSPTTRSAQVASVRTTRRFAFVPVRCARR